MNKCKSILNLLLLIFFIVTILAPLTGVQIHKMASALFLLLSVVHTVVYRKKLGAKKYVLLGVIIIAFMTGLFGMIFDQSEIILTLHKVISIVSVFFLAIHIFVHHRRFAKKSEARI